MLALPTSQKRKHKTLTLSVKAEILKKMEAGERMCDLARFYGIGRATIYDLKQNKEKIQKFIQNTDFNLGHRHTLKYGEYPEVEEALYQWITQEKAKNVVFSGELIQEKAKQFYKQIVKEGNFKASCGWLDKFKKRYGIRFTNSLERNRKSEVILASMPQKFQEKLKELALIPDQIYSVEVSRLFWRYTPSKVLKNRALKDQIILMPCSNASGRHKLDLFLMGNEAKSWIDDTNSAINYMTIKQEIITKEIFLEWFNEYFTPAVTEFLIREQLPQRALLILHSDVGFTSEDVIHSKHNFFQAIFLHKTEDNISKMLKTFYKNNLMHNIAKQKEFLSGFTLENAVITLSNSWKSISNNILIDNWKNIWPSHNLISNDIQSLATTERNTLDSQFRQALEKLCQNSSSPILNEDEINNWLSDNVVNDVDYTENDSDFSADVKKEFECVNDDYKDYEVTSNVVQVENEILTAFDVCIKWSEQNGVNLNDIGVLKRLRQKCLKESATVKESAEIEGVFVNEPGIKCEFLTE